jgi:nucleoside transporter
MIPYLRTRLSLQMFLQFAIWGSWAPVLGRHLERIGLDAVQIGAIYGTGALATMISPLIAGQIADRWFATQKFLSVSYAAAGVLFFVAARTVDYETLWALSLGAMLFFAPTLALGNSISFHHLSDARAQFPAIRVWGTIGWIAAGWILAGWLHLWEDRPIGDCLNLAAVFAALNAAYCLTLPATPPRRDAAEPFAVGKVLAMLKDGSFALFTVLAFLLMVFATFYYFRSANFFPAVGIQDKNLSIVTSIGQITEILTMFVLPWVFLRLGSKRTIALGILAWAVRFYIFAIGAPLELVIAAQALHGVCFAFVIAAAMIYVERVCAPDVRASAQSLLTFVTYGAGMFVGAWLGGTVSDHFTTEGVADWRSIWLVPTAGCAAVLLLFLAGFRARDAEKPTAPAVAADPRPVKA